jgi:hypothetical protein
MPRVRQMNERRRATVIAQLEADAVTDDTRELDHELGRPPKGAADEGYRLDDAEGTDSELLDGEDGERNTFCASIERNTRSRDLHVREAWCETVEALPIDVGLREDGIDVDAGALRGLEQDSNWKSGYR